MFLSDQEIISLFCERSENAITELNTSYGAYLKNIAFHILGKYSDIDEVLNDTYFAVWNRIPPEEPKVLRHYLSRITRNLAFKRLEYASAAKRSSEGIDSLDELADCVPDTRENVEGILEAREIGAAVNRWLGTLSEEKQAVFVLRYYYSFSLREIANRMGCSERRVKYLLSTMRGSLKEQLEREGFGE